MVAHPRTSKPHRLTDEQRRDMFENGSHLIEEAVARGVALAIEDHRRAGNPIVVWRDGKIVWIPADQIPPLGEPGIDEA